MNLPINIQKDLDAIVCAINDILPEAKVYLFGSYATGTQREDSDIDICVVVPEFRVRQMETIHLVNLAIFDVTKMPVDVLAFRNEDFEHRSKFKSQIHHKIKHKGVLLSGPV